MFLNNFLIIAVILTTTNAQTFSLGNCNNELETMKNFNTAKYAGNWYMIKRSHNEAQDPFKCYRVAMTLNDNGYDILANVAFKTGIPLKMSLTAKPNDPGRPERMTFAPGFIDDSQQVWVLDTDYDNYSIGYSCMNAYKGKLESVSINSRTSKMDETILANVLKLLKERNINLTLIEEIQNCE